MEDDIIPINTLNEGLQKAVDNSTRYLNDALLLYENKRFSSCFLISMLSFEESGKALLLIAAIAKKQSITSKQWRKDFCNHCKKNLVSIKSTWEDAHFTSRFPDWDKHLANFDFEWKNAFTYVDYDFGVNKWISPTAPESFGAKNDEHFASTAMSRAAKALQIVVKKCSKDST